MKTAPLSFILLFSFLCTFVFTFLCSSSAFSQTVRFTTDSIIIGNKPCLLYERIATDSFNIMSLDSIILITGKIVNLAPQKFSTTYDFVETNKLFYKEGVNGRNAIIFFLIQEKVLESCELNEQKLIKFIKKYNQVPPPQN
jgi:hypothetical protein